METIAETLNPTGEGQQDDFTEWMRSPAAQFLGAKRLPDGTYVGVQRLMFTHAICIGVTPSAAYTRRYCYEDTTALLHSYANLTSFEAQPEGWVAKRPL